MIKRFIFVVSILFSMFAYAQEGTSSPYSYYGVGLTTFKGTVENQSMGGISVFSDSIHLNLQNPAGYGKLGLTTYSVGGTYSTVSMKTESEKENYSNTTFDYIAVGLPAGKFGFGFGLMPYTSVGYDLVTRNEGEGTVGQVSGNGGVNKVYLSAAYELTRSLSLGAGAEYNFGNIENKNVFVREGLENASSEVNRSRIAGLTFNVGLQYQQMLTETLQVMGSAVYSPERNLDSENKREVSTFNVLSGQPYMIEEINVEDTDLRVPEKYTFGLGMGRPRKWFLGAEYSSIGEGSFNNRSFSPERSTYTEANSYKLGGFFIPDYKSLTSYFSRVVYRAGFRMEETGLQLDGEPVDEFGISFGIGLPAGTFYSNANLGVEYGQRGTTSAGLIQEDFFRLSISLSLNDRWFIKRRFE